SADPEGVPRESASVARALRCGAGRQDPAGTGTFFGVRTRAAASSPAGEEDQGRIDPTSPPRRFDPLAAERERRQSGSALPHSKRPGLGSGPESRKPVLWPSFGCGSAALWYTVTDRRSDRKGD